MNGSMFFLLGQTESAVTFDSILEGINNFVSGAPLIILILAVGLYLTVRLGLLQILKLPKAFKYAVSDEEGGKGEVTSFGALCTALSATIGTGNIVGVATAIVAGGPGALFWMWLAAFFGMATKYAEGVLAIKYRKVYDDGHILGGPFYYIENGMGKKYIWLAKLFAVLCLCVGLMGIGTFTQVNGIANAVNSFFDPSNAYTLSLFGKEYSYTVILTSLVVAGLTALVIIGGIKRIAKVSEFIVPFMAITYFICCFIILLLNADKIPMAITRVFEGAFGLRAAAGGAFGAMFVAMQKGIARGIFSNESGLGSAPIAAAAAKTKEPVRQGLVSMTGTFIDTIIICTMTGLSILVTNADGYGLEGVNITIKAFCDGLPFNADVSSFLLMLCLVFFAFTTILGWNYYSERSLEYLTKGNKRALSIFKMVYVFAVLIGPFMTVSAVWTIADIFNSLMAFPNLAAIICLSGVVIKETKEYFKKL